MDSPMKPGQARWSLSRLRRGGNDSKKNIKEAFDTMNQIKINDTTLA
jgi:hypothetical protein